MVMYKYGLHTVEQFHGRYNISSVFTFTGHREDSGRKPELLNESSTLLVRQ
jgi:hypothetical protein